MGAKTKIPWADATWNPWQGCTPVSEGCDHCYMYRDKKRYGQDPTKVVRSKSKTFTMPLRLEPNQRVFVCSWSDFFHEAADGWREDAWKIIRQCPSQTFMILTKRAHRIRDCLPEDWGNGYHNVWLGITAENQQRFEERWMYLQTTPAVVRFVSVEPMLSRVSMMDALPRRKPNGDLLEVYKKGIVGYVGWVICGEESGPKGRIMDITWAQNLLLQCRKAGVPFFFKQTRRPNGTMNHDPEIDGRTWKEFPSGYQQVS